MDSSAPFDDREPYKFGEAKEWRDLSGDRAARLEQQRQRMSKAEMEIQKSLSNKVDVKFNERPLAEVMDLLSELSGVPIVLDPVGMAAEGVTTRHAGHHPAQPADLAAKCPESRARTPASELCDSGRSAARDQRADT